MSGGRRHVPDPLRLASANQLWVLNRAGRLVVVEEAGRPLTSADVWPVIRDLKEGEE